jgi:hypothetical protein
MWPAANSSGVRTSMVVTPGLATTSAKRAASTRSGALGAATGAVGPWTVAAAGERHESGSHTP